MPRVMRGTRDAKGTNFFKQPVGGTGRLRCMKCSGIASSVTLANGTTVMRCAACGAQYTAAPLGTVGKTVPMRVGVARPKQIPR